MKGKGWFDWLSSNSAGDEKLRLLRDKLDALLARASDIDMELEHAEIQPGKKRRAEVQLWLTNVDRKKKEFQNIEKQIQEVGFNSKLTGQIESMAKEVQELFEQGKFPHGLVLHDRESTRFSLLSTKLVGSMFELNAEKIMGWLKATPQSMFGVFGMGGVGKTTLLMHIHNQVLNDSNIFGRVYWLTVSQNSSFYKLQHDIGKVVGLDLSNETDKMKRAATLHDRLTQMGKMVLILDDMWETFPVDIVGIPVGENNCKVILSTRQREVCQRMGCSGDHIIEVKILAQDEARNLFADRLLNYEELDTEVKEIAKLVADECSSLPLAIITIAGSMRGVFDMQEWHNLLDELRNPSRMNSDMENDVIQILKYSYDRLNDEVVKHCFLSCVLYPEDEEIIRENLVDLWMMEGLLEAAGSRKAQLNKGHTILNKLLRSCLLESVYDNEECVDMHDLIRDMAISITQNRPRFMAKAGMALKEVPDEEHWKEDLAKVSLMTNEIQKIPCNILPRCAQLTVLMLNDNIFLKEIPESFFVHMKALRVLDLSRTSIRRLPESVSCLENLRALLLQGCRSLTYVPSVKKLRKLRVLEALNVGDRFEVPQGIERLKFLEKLSCGWNISNVTDFNKIIESCHMMCSYKCVISVDGKYYSVPDELALDGTVDNVVVIANVAFGLQEPSSILLPSRIRHLVMEDCDIKGRTSVGDLFPSLGSATELEVLHIYHSRGLKYISSAPHQDSSICAQLDTIKELHLSQLSDLEGMIQGGGESPESASDELPSSSSSSLPSLLPLVSNASSTCMFSHLKSFYIYRCHKMKVVFKAELIRQQDQLHQQPLFPNLEVLTVKDCSELEVIFENEDESGKATNNMLILALPKLRRLTLWRLPKLGSIYNRGLLCCASLELNYFDWYCPELRMAPLSLPLMCDESASTLACIPKCADNPQWWEALRQHYPHDALALSYLVNQVQPQRSDCHQDRDGMDSHFDQDDADQDRKRKREWGQSLSLSVF